MMKPDEKIYYRLIDKFKLCPEESFFVDDSERNIMASKKCGLDGHIFDMNNLQGLLDELRKRDVLI